MKKGLLTSIICFSSLVFSSCGSKYFNIKILNCEHCSFENKTQARVGQDFVIQANVERGYFLEKSADLIEIKIVKDDVKILEYGFDYNETTNQLTIHKEYTTFGDISIKANAFPKTSHLKFDIGSNKYEKINESYEEEITVEADYKINLKTTEENVPLTQENIQAENHDLSFKYDSSTKDFSIAKEYLYKDITVKLP